MSGHYILKDKEIIKVPLMEWAKWFEDADRTIKKEDINNYHISTVFLGLDHNFSTTGEPVLFETMVFPISGPTGEIDYGEVDCDRYTSYNKALKGHKKMAKKWGKKK
jgi:hypothetical protein